MELLRRCLKLNDLGWIALILIVAVIAIIINQYGNNLTPSLNKRPVEEINIEPLPWNIHTINVDKTDSLGIGFARTKEDIVRDVLKMKDIYNLHLHKSKVLDTETMKRIFRMATTQALSMKEEKMHFTGVLYPFLLHSNDSFGTPFILTIDEIIEFETAAIEDVIFNLKKNGASEARLEERLNKLRLGKLELIKFKEDERRFHLLIDRKIKNRTIDGTAYVDEHRFGSNYQWFRRINQALKDIKSEYESTGVCFSQRYIISENERIKRNQERLAERQKKEMEELRQLKISMYSDPPKKIETKKDFSKRIFSKEDKEYISNGYYEIDGERFMSIWTYKNWNDIDSNTNSENGRDSYELISRGFEHFKSRPDFGSYSDVYIFDVKDLDKFYS